VSREWSKKRLLARGRGDDTAQDIEERLTWYESNVMPTIEFFRKDPYYKVVDVNAEQTIEEVQKEILEKISS
jgi:adenylate kinase family enzyme